VIRKPIKGHGHLQILLVGDRWLAGSNRAAYVRLKHNNLQFSTASMFRQLYLTKPAQKPVRNQNKQVRVLSDLTNSSHFLSIRICLTLQSRFALLNFAGPHSLLRRAAVHMVQQGKNALKTLLTHTKTITCMNFICCISFYSISSFWGSIFNQLQLIEMVARDATLGWGRGIQTTIKTRNL
jgi:hypothetical protein